MNNKTNTSHISVVREFKTLGKNVQKRVTVPSDSSLIANDYVLITRVDPKDLDLLKKKIINVEFTNKLDISWKDLKKKVNQNEKK